MKLFGRRKPSALDLLRDTPWTCAQCGIEHRGLFDLAAFAPDQWEGKEEYEPNSALRLEGDFLSEDFCVLRGEHFFVRCVFDIPVRGLAEKFGYGVWSTLSRANFERYVDAFDTGACSDMGPWSGWFSNRLSTFQDSLNQACWVHPQLDRQRPVISLDDPDHELARAQQDGVMPERLLELYAAHGHGPAAT